MVRLTGMVVCKNEVKRIQTCLESLSFCDELVVVDSGSTDGTLDIIRSRGAHLFERPWKNINDQKEFGREVSTGAWLLNIDADEVVTRELRDEIEKLVDSGGDPSVGAWRIPFRNHFRSSWVRRSGYYPDPHVRFMRRDRARWDPTAPVHDRVLVEGGVGALAGHIDHHSFESVAHFIAKSNVYAASFASDAHSAGRRAGLATIAAHTFARFIKAYLLKGGILEGTLGLTISGLQAFEVFQKYVRLWELSRGD